MKWWKPDIYINRRQWVFGLEWWQGSVFVFIGPIEMVW
jgi:hypothetical protein